MTDEELDAEHKALLAEHAALEARHRALRESPHDIEGHRRLSGDLRHHIQRLHDHVAALHEREKKQR